MTPLPTILETHRFLRIAEKLKEPCRCGAMPESFMVEDGPHAGGHWAKVVCPNGHYVAWLQKPEGDRSKYRRPVACKDLVAKYSAGYCELCLRKAEDLPLPQTLEAQHIIEFADGGTEERANIWIVCTACHRLIHWQRTYIGHYAGKESA